MKRFTPILQNDKADCGPACLLSIFKYYGLKISISELKDICGTDREGTSASGLIRGLAHYHYQYRALNMTPDGLTPDLPYPAVAHMITDDGLLHYVVVLKVKKDSIKLCDPAKGILTCKKDQFLKNWTGFLLLTSPSDDSVTGNHEKNNLLSFCRLILAQKRSIFLIILLSVICTGIGVITSYYYQTIMDKIVPSASFSYLTQVSLGIIILYLAQILLSVIRSIIMIKYEQRLDTQLTLGYYYHTLLLPMRFYTMRDTGDIISRFSDIGSVQSLISEATVGVFLDAFMAIAGAVILCRYNPQMFLVAFIMMAVYALIVFLYTGPLMKMNRQILDDNAKVTSRFIESVNGIETIKSFNNEKRHFDKVSGMYKDLLKKNFHIGMISLSESTLISTISSLGGVAILWVGTAGVLKGNLSIGELITFNALLGYFIGPVTNLINLQPTIQAAVVSVNRIGEVLDYRCEYDAEKPAHVQPLPDFKRIRVQDLTFSYGTRKPVLKNVSLTITQGQKIGFVGNSGSGKTTLAKLLVGLFQTSDQTIFYNDVDMNTIYKPELRKKILYLSQDVFLQNGSLRENLLNGREDIEESDFNHICELCGIQEMADSLPLGFETLIEENGKNLSGGQKQRISIARALLGKPQVLIMDEATSSLDNISEKMIGRALSECANHMTLIQIAHRLTTVKNCDRIYVFDNGSLVEEGTHVQLLQNKYYYYRLWNEVQDHSHTQPDLLGGFDENI